MRKVGPQHAGKRPIPNLGLAVFFAVVSVLLLAGTLVLLFAMSAA